MDPKLLFWTAALVNMWAVVGVAVAGIARAYGGDEEGHRRRMLCAAGLVGLFVLAYAIKLIVLGREDLDVWQPWAVNLLRIHELFIFIMLVAGGRAGYLAWTFRKLEAIANFDAGRCRELRGRHRHAGTIAFAGAFFGAVTASGMLIGMFLRS